jgi:acyl transferase domain-containing protein
MEYEGIERLEALTLHGADRFKVPTTQRPWPRNKKFASVNNFGFGGTNAHAVLERAPFIRAEEKTASESGRKLFVLSASDKTALESQMKNLGIYLEQRPEIFQNALMGNLAYTLGERRVSDSLII